MRRPRTLHGCLGVIHDRGQREMYSRVFAKVRKRTRFMDIACKQECIEDTFRRCCRFIVFLKIVLSVFPPGPGFLAMLPSLYEFHCCPLASPWSVYTLP